MFEQELLFVLHQVRKQVFLDYKIWINKVTTLYFIKAMIFVKKKTLKFHLCLFFDMQGLKIMFDDHLVQKQPMILVKKIKNFLFVCFRTIEA